MWNKKDDNFLAGLFVGSMLFGRKKRKENEETGEKKNGCLDSILGAVVIGIFIYLWISTGSFIAALVISVVLIIAIGAAIAIIGNKLTYASTVSEEALALYNEGQFTQAYEKALPIAEKNPLAAYIAGMCLRFGDGCNKDEQKAFVKALSL